MCGIRVRATQVFLRKQLVAGESSCRPVGSSRSGIIATQAPATVSGSLHTNLEQNDPAV
jgi:hypothetical protein